MSAKRGAFILLEGCDRSGKSTQSKKLVSFLEAKGIPVKHLGFPDRSTSTGKMIDQYLQNHQNLPDEAIHLLFSANRWECHGNLLGLLNGGTTIVVDRYSYSGVAYTAAKGLDYEWCMNPERGLVQPDVVIYLKTDVDEIIKRGGFGDERYEKAEFQRKVSDMFDRIYREQQQGTWHLIKADNPVEEVHKTISEIAMNVLKEVEEKPLQKIK